AARRVALLTGIRSNAMGLVRGPPGYFEDGKPLGNPGWGWGWADVLPWFRRMETNDRGGDAFRGDSGPLHVTTTGAQIHPLCAHFIRAGQDLGWSHNPDFNGARQDGVGAYQITVKDGLRMSAARAYLHPARRRGNLHVIRNAMATRILLVGRRATGIAFRQGGRIIEARARREVILSAGAVNSPQLLLLSGVGPVEALRRVGIAPHLALDGVGRNMQDPLCIDHLYRSRLPSLNEQLRPWHGKLRQGLRYLLTRRGPLALGVNQAGGFVSTAAGGGRANMQLFFSPLSYTKAPPGKRPLMSPDPFPGFLVSAQPTRPTSRGHLTIRSADPFAPPEIHPNYLATDHDRQEMLEATRLLRDLAATPALSAIIDAEISPGPEVQGDAALMEDCRARAGTVFHPVGTCRMGPDPETDVVDSRLRLHGLAGLRVVDASIFPTLTSGNTNAPVIMVAEKAADMILADAAKAV
ncbi:MAG: GMC family oxidoreductase, partial [Pseudorhodobacter sp.]